ncbi:hypothetical protein [Clostridium pasteurianum]|nr:hypothetical protein [Clostridium pasteurianum]
MMLQKCKVKKQNVSQNDGCTFCFFVQFKYKVNDVEVLEWKF